MNGYMPLRLIPSLSPALSLLPACQLTRDGTHVRPNKKIRKKYLQRRHQRYVDAFHEAGHLDEFWIEDVVLPTAEEIRSSLRRCLWWTALVVLLLAWWCGEEVDYYSAQGDPARLAGGSPPPAFAPSQAARRSPAVLPTVRREEGGGGAWRRGRKHGGGYIHAGDGKRFFGKTLRRTNPDR